MSLLLYENYKVQSPLDSIEVINRLKKVIGQEGVVNEYMFGTTPYYGKLIDPYFTATRIAGYRLFSRGISFGMPVINGRVQTEATGCSIDFSISPGNVGKKVVILFTGIMSLLSLIGLAFFVWATIESRSVEQIISLILMGIIIISYLIQWIRFKIEAITYRIDFSKLFDTEIEP